MTFNHGIGMGQWCLFYMNTYDNFLRLLYFLCFFLPNHRQNTIY